MDSDSLMLSSSVSPAMNLVTKGLNRKDFRTMDSTGLSAEDLRMIERASDIG
jgi:hypothetical protein